MSIERFPEVAALAALNQYRTRDLDEARSFIGSLFKPHELSILGPRQSLDVAIGGGGVDGAALIYHRHGARVRVSPGRLEDFYLLQVPLRGGARFRHGNFDFECGPGEAGLLSPHLDLEMEFSEDCEQVILRVDRDVMESVLGRCFDAFPDRPVTFLPHVSLNRGSGPHATLLLRYLAASLANAPTQAIQIGRAQAELIAGALLNEFPSDYQDRVAACRPVGPGYVKAAQDYIEDSMSLNLTPEEIAEAVNVSPRALYAGFRRHLQTTPMRYLKSVRLMRVQQALKKADPAACSVSQIALDHGFAHFGHFSVAYKAEFGELPSETLRKRRRS